VADGRVVLLVFDVVVVAMVVLDTAIVVLVVLDALVVVVVAIPHAVSAMRLQSRSRSITCLQRRGT